jgi:hypothetical protein
MQKRLAVAAIAAVSLAGCGSGRGSTAPSSVGSSPSTVTTDQTTPTSTSGSSTGGHSQRSKQASRCITKGGYAGLYATVAAFNADHNTTKPSEPTPGVPWYHILLTARGCVTAYSVDELTSPPQSASDIVFLTDGISLPDDHTQAVDKGNCVVFSSATLRRASGSKFAKAIGTAQSGQVPAHAEIHVTNDGTC